MPVRLIRLLILRVRIKIALRLAEWAAREIDRQTRR